MFIISGNKIEGEINGVSVEIDVESKVGIVYNVVDRVVRYAMGDIEDLVECYTLRFIEYLWGLSTMPVMIDMSNLSIYEVVDVLNECLYNTNKGSRIDFKKLLNGVKLREEK